MRIQAGLLARTAPTVLGGSQVLLLIPLLALALLPGTLGAADRDDIHPDAKHVLTEMSELLTAAKTLRFRAEASLDEAFSDGLMVQSGWTVDFTARRPDRLFAVSSDPYPRRLMWYDGSTWSILFVGQEKYSTARVPPSLDDALDMMTIDYGVNLPMADFLYSRPFEVLTELATEGLYLGKQLVDGVLCHHLVFRQETIDWQIWIADGGLPLPQKTVITYKDLPGSPQFSVRLSGWDLTTPAGEATFVFTPSEELERVEFMTLSELAKRSAP